MTAPEKTSEKAVDGAPKPGWAQADLEDPLAVLFGDTPPDRDLFARQLRFLLDVTPPTGDVHWIQFPVTGHETLELGLVTATGEDHASVIVRETAPARVLHTRNHEQTDHAWDALVSIAQALYAFDRATTGVGPAAAAARRLGDHLTWDLQTDSQTHDFMTLHLTWSIDAAPAPGHDLSIFATHAVTREWCTIVVEHRRPRPPSGHTYWHPPGCGPSHFMMHSEQWDPSEFTHIAARIATCWTDPDHQHTS